MKPYIQCECLWYVWQPASLTEQAYETDCALTDFVTPRPIRSYMFPPSDGGSQHDVGGRVQQGEAGEFWEEQLFGGAFGFDPSEAEVGRGTALNHKKP